MLFWVLLQEHTFYPPRHASFLLKRGTNAVWFLCWSYLLRSSYRTIFTGCVGESTPVWRRVLIYLISVSFYLFKIHVIIIFLPLIRLRPCHYSGVLLLCWSACWPPTCLSVRMTLCWKARKCTGQLRRLTRKIINPNVVHPLLGFLLFLKDESTLWLVKINPTTISTLSSTSLESIPVDSANWRLKIIWKKNVCNENIQNFLAIVSQTIQPKNSLHNIYITLGVVSHLEMTSSRSINECLLFKAPQHRSAHYLMGTICIQLKPYFKFWICSFPQASSMQCNSVLWCQGVAVAAAPRQPYYHEGITANIPWGTVSNELHKLFNSLL